LIKRDTQSNGGVSFFEKNKENNTIQTLEEQFVAFIHNFSSQNIVS
jgi:hypothetical protein